MSCQATVMTVLILISSCGGQDKVKVDPEWRATLIGRILNEAHASGSLVYQGQCQDRGGALDLPTLTFPKQRDAPALQILSEMFANDAKMRLTHDPKGYIRMVETDVPQDLLSLRISQISFSSDHDSIDSPTKALWQILAAPEVKDYMGSKNIGPVLPDSFAYSILSPPNASRISGNLYYVTVSEALDYILKTYPGFWAYENCIAENGGHTVFFHFFPAIKSGVVKFP